MPPRTTSRTPIRHETSILTKAPGEEGVWRELSGAAPTRRARGPREHQERRASPRPGASRASCGRWCRPSPTACGCTRCRSPGSPRRPSGRGGSSSEIGREVCRRHFYFVKGSARERADRADIAHAGFDDVRPGLQTVDLSGPVLCLSSYLATTKLSLEFLT